MIQHWLIWSKEHQGWWRSAECGYSADVSEAGCYSAEDALRICEKANRYSDGVIHEIAVPAAVVLQGLDALKETVDIFERQLQERYRTGASDATRRWAWYKDGVQYVGCGINTLKEALEKI